MFKLASVFLTLHNTSLEKYIKRLNGLREEQRTITNTSRQTFPSNDTGSSWFEMLDFAGAYRLNVTYFPELKLNYSRIPEAKYQ